MEISIGLINQCLSNNRTAQNELYRELLPYLNLVCQRYLQNKNQRQDVLQEAFIRIFRHLAQYDIQRASFKTWATKIAINCCLKNNKRLGQQPTDELLLPIHDAWVGPEIFKKLSNKDLIKWMKKMPQNYREVFNLHVVDGFSHREIAQILNIDEALSRKRLARSRAWLRQRLPDEFRPNFSNNLN